MSDRETESEDDGSLDTVASWVDDGSLDTVALWVDAAGIYKFTSTDYTWQNRGYITIISL